MASDFKSAYYGTLTYHNIRRSITNADTPITSGSKISYRAIIKPDEWFLDIYSISLKAGNTPNFNTQIALIDFTQLDWCLPIPINITQVFGTGFNVQTTRPNDNNYNTNNAYIARIELTLSSDTKHHSTRITTTNFSNSKTITNDITNAIVNPNQYHCSLDLEG